MVHNKSDFLLDPIMLRQVIYVSLLVGNLLFFLIHSANAEVSALGALSLLLW